MKLVIKKLCWNCRKEFRLFTENNNCLKKSITTFDDCSFCGERNDTWLAVDWPTEAEVKGTSE